MFAKITRIYCILVLIPVLLFAQRLHYDVHAQLDPKSHQIEVENKITIPAAALKETMYFILHGNMELTTDAANVTVVKANRQPKAADFGIPEERFHLTENVPHQLYEVHLLTSTSRDLTFSVNYRGEIFHEVKQMSEEYARAFSETPGIIAEKGVYLSNSSAWIPWFGEEMFTFNLDVGLPQEWDAVSQGNRTRHEIQNGKRLVRWESPEPMEEIYLIAAKFTEYRKTVGAVTAMAFLRTPEENLANKYLETTAQYMEMYRQLIGPFPFKKFALVENFWQTGYGMPSFTLLGDKIIRFPFILHSSYPHELLHNWWGNSVYVDYETGNWCEGLTAYMADHLIKEQRGQGAEYRLSTLQRYTDYVNAGNDFPLTDFRSRRSAATEAVGYGKSLMLWHMLRRKVGDEMFIRAMQTFNRQNKFKKAGFDDLRKAFEQVTGQDFKALFDQWVKRSGAPYLQLKNVSATANNGGYDVSFAIEQKQGGEPFRVDVPVAIFLKDKVVESSVNLSDMLQSFSIHVESAPLQIAVDPQFDIFRRLDTFEIPPALSKIFGAKQVLIVLPSEDDRQSAYRQLAETWKSENVQITEDAQLNELPADKAVWIFGVNNKFRAQVENGLQKYDMALSDVSVRFGKTEIPWTNNSFIISIRHPGNPASAIVWLTLGNNAAVPGLARKLPHYGKYSYLAFEGDEPTNVAKGQWPAVNSPLVYRFSNEASTASLAGREALARLGAVFSEENMIRHIGYLASEELAGRGLGTPGLDNAAEYIADRFKEIGLQPGGDDGTFFQTWEAAVGPSKKPYRLRNVIGIIKGSKSEWADQSVIVSAHYDHLGTGWPDVHKGDEGKIHYGADDNASGVAVMLELAALLKKTIEPERTIVFVAFTGEESGLLGSKHYVAAYKTYPAVKAIGVLNLDTVGRLGKGKIQVIGSGSAKEWKHIFMGSSFVTGIESEMVTQDLVSSDQAAFVAADVPGVQFFSGAHTDYHRPTDTADKIDAAGLVKVATFVREATVYLTEREEPMTFSGSAKKEVPAMQKPGGRRASTGTMPDFAFSGEGVRVASVGDGSPADKAGLKTGDIIVEFGGVMVKNLREYSNELKKYKPGDTVEIVVDRNGRKLKKKITLSAR